MADFTSKCCTLRNCRQLISSVEKPANPTACIAEIPIISTTLIKLSTMCIALQFSTVLSKHALVSELKEGGRVVLSYQKSRDQSLA